MGGGGGSSPFNPLGGGAGSSPINPLGGGAIAGPPPAAFDCAWPVSLLVTAFDVVLRTLYDRGSVDCCVMSLCAVDDTPGEGARGACAGTGVLEVDVPPASAVADLLCKPVDDPPLGCVDFP